ncbi:SRPBCC family protein [Sphingobacterium sp. HJSM2_6]|uniref:SRPBCC family protein n=1 Tax=Sphingobacterium sp. HJSM2_6 TaxID=3366264 RepID=UPI003BCB3CC7
MKAKIETQIQIFAPIENVWDVLSDFESYPLWSEFIKQFDGIPEVGRRTKVHLEAPESMKIVMNPVFLVIAEQEEIRWKGKLVIPGIFDGEHYFKLEASGPNQTKLTQGENFSGILIPFLKKMINVNTKQGFNTFNKAIKKRVEDLL